MKEVYIAWLVEPQRLEDAHIRSVLLFCGSVRACQALGQLLQELGVGAAVLHRRRPLPALLFLACF